MMLKLGKYNSLDQKKIKSDFLDYIDCLELPFIDYVAIGVQDNIHKTSTSITSRDEWQKTFKNLGLAPHDPVRKAAFNTNSKFFAFDEVDYQNKFGKEIMHQRKLHEINNGVVIMDRKLGHNFMLTLATSYSKFNAYNFLYGNTDSIFKVFYDLKAIVSPATKDYQIKPY